MGVFHFLHGDPSAVPPAAQLLRPLSYSTTLTKESQRALFQDPPKFSKAILPSDSAFFRVVLPRVKRYHECNLFSGSILG